jgi:hypothetical protein
MLLSKWMNLALFLALAPDTALAHAEPHGSIADMFLDPAFINGCLGTMGGLVVLNVESTYAGGHDELVEQIHTNLWALKVANEVHVTRFTEGLFKPSCDRDISMVAPEGEAPRLTLFLTLFQDGSENFDHAKLVVYRTGICHEVELMVGQPADTCGLPRYRPRPERPPPRRISAPAPDIAPEEATLEARLSAPFRLQLRLVPFVQVNRRGTPWGGGEVMVDVDFEADRGPWFGVQARSLFALTGFLANEFVGTLGYSGRRAGAALAVGSANTAPYLRIGARLRFGNLARTHGRFEFQWPAWIVPAYIRAEVLIRIPRISLPLWIGVHGEWFMTYMNAALGSKVLLGGESAVAAHFLTTSIGVGSLILESVGPQLVLGYEARFDWRSRPQ